MPQITREVRRRGVMAGVTKRELVDAGVEISKALNSEFVISFTVTAHVLCTYIRLV